MDKFIEHKLRESRSRKTSRLDTMNDVFNTMLISSDPFLSSIRNTNSSHIKTEFKAAVLDLLLKEPSVESDDEEN